MQSDPFETDLTGKEGNELKGRQSGETTDPNDSRDAYGAAAPPGHSLSKSFENRGSGHSPRNRHLPLSRLQRPRQRPTPPQTRTSLQDLVTRFAHDRLHDGGLRAD